MSERVLARGGCAGGLGNTMFRAHDDQANTAHALRRLGSIAVDQQDVARATALLDESEELLRDAGTAWDAAFAVYLAGRLAVARGDHHDAVCRFAEAAEAFQTVGDRSYVAAALGQQGAAALRLGNHPMARRVYATSLTIAHELHELGGVSSALHGTAHLALHAGDPYRAAQLLAASTRMLEKLGQRLRDDGLAETLIAALGHPGFEAAWQHGLAMPLEAVVSEAMLVSSGGEDTLRPGREVLAPPVLTRREREVLRLMVAGHTDKEIAADLGITRHTATHHVTAIRKKLGAPSRAVATARAMREALL